MTALVGPVIQVPDGARRPDAVNVAVVIDCTEAEGPGRRLALWVQGCPMRCPGCCNPEMLPFTDNTWTPVPDLVARVEKAALDSAIEGVTFLGGEPFSQAGALASLAASVRAMGLSVMIFTGFTAETLRASSDTDVAALLAQTDLLVDGQFDRDDLDHDRRWIGSKNQQPVDMSGQYADLVSDWDTSPNTLEVRIIGGKLFVNGSPFLMDKLGTKRRLDD